MRTFSILMFILIVANSLLAPLLTAAPNHTRNDPPDLQGLMIPITLRPDPYDWGANIPQDIVDRLVTLAQIDDPTLETLIASDDPLQRGAAIFVLNYRGDFRRLWALSDWLDDERPTLPASVGAHRDPGTYPRIQQTVGKYLGEMYVKWFGASKSSSKAFQKYFQGIDDPGLLVRPWVNQLLRQHRPSGEPAKSHAAVEMPRIKAEINKLPDSLRWAVIVDAYIYNVDVYTKEEAAQALKPLKHLRGTLPDQPGQKIAGDPTFPADGEMAKRLVATFMELTKEP